MNKKEIYNQIKEIAAELLVGKVQFTRADLVYELKSRGFSATPLEVSQWVYESYLYFNKSSEIEVAFVTNDKVQPLVEESKLHILLADGKDQLAFQLLDSRLKKSITSLQLLKEVTSQSLEGGDLAKSWDLVGVLQGTSGVKKSQQKAELLFEKYKNLIESYTTAQEDVKGGISDFVEVRNHVAVLYQEYVQRLIDLFGDSISAIAPEIFDFDSVEFLDVDGMLTQVKLEYERLFSECETFMGEIETSFRLSLTSSSQAFNESKSKEAAVILAAVNFFNHYASSADKELRLNREFEKIKRFVKHDVTLIKGDLGRLMIIYKSLNDLFIPKANAFLRFSQQLFEGELKQLFDLLYQDPKVKELVKKRENLTATYKELLCEISDNELHLGFFQTSIANAKQLLDEKKMAYQECKDQRPSKPFFLVNWITFGNAGSSYRRSMFEWKKYNYPVIEEYENYKLDLKLDTDELANIEGTLSKQYGVAKEIKEDLQQLNDSIMKHLHVSDSLKQKFINHLEPMLKVLRIGKDILESKLDKQLRQTVVIEDLRDVELPTQLKEGISGFANHLREMAIGSSSRPIEQEGIEGSTQQTAQVEDAIDQDEQRFMDQSDELIQRGIDVLENWSLLEAEKAKGRMVGSAYDAQLEALKKQFSAQMEQLDNEQLLLQSVLKRINTASNADQLKEGFLLLLGNSATYSREELEQFMNGNLKLKL
ncbi:MAG: hypothetical protein ACRCZY_09625 [Phocaeicola sp.]